VQHSVRYLTADGVYPERSNHIGILQKQFTVARREYFIHISQQGGKTAWRIELQKHRKVFDARAMSGKSPQTGKFPLQSAMTSD
jgi:hypothetical protein